jgi:outer membrane protein
MAYGNRRQIYSFTFYKFRTFMRILFLSVVFFLFAFSAKAQKVWTLEECIDYALANNIDVALQDINIELATLGVQQKKHAFGPNINANIDFTQSFGRSIDFTTYQFNNIATSSNRLAFSNNIDLFQGMQRLNDLKKGNLELEYMRTNKTVTEQNIQLQLLSAFLSVVMAKEQLLQAEKQKVNTQKEYDRVKSMVKAGLAAENDTYFYEAQLATNNISITSFKNNIELGLSDLKLLLRLAPDTEFDIEVPELPNPENLEGLVETIDQIYEIALSNRPEIKNAELDEKINEFDLKIAKGGYYPTLSFSNNIITNFSNQAPPSIFGGDAPTYFRQLNENMAYSLGATLAIPIFNKNFTRLAVQQSNININQSKLYTEKARQELYQAIVRAYNNALFAVENYKANQANEMASLKALNGAQSRLKAGLGSDVEFTVASNNYDIAVSKLIEAKYSYIFNIKYLEFYKGIPIDLN